MKTVALCMLVLGGVSVAVVRSTDFFSLGSVPLPRVGTSEADAFGLLGTPRRSEPLAEAVKVDGYQFQAKPLVGECEPFRTDSPDSWRALNTLANTGQMTHWYSLFGSRVVVVLVVDARVQCVLLGGT